MSLDSGKKEKKTFSKKIKGNFLFQRTIQMFEEEDNFFF
jgi:hypothetical protein